MPEDFWIICKILACLLWIDLPIWNLKISSKHQRRTMNLQFPINLKEHRNRSREKEIWKLKLRTFRMKINNNLKLIKWVTLMCHLKSYAIIGVKFFQSKKSTSKKEKMMKFQSEWVQFNWAQSIKNKELQAFKNCYKIKFKITCDWYFKSNINTL